MLRAVVSETCSPGDQEEDYSSLLNIIGISVAIGAVGGQLIGHATQLLITGARKRMQARASAATASRHEQVQGEYESAGADAGVAATAVTEPGYEEAVQPTVPLTGAPITFAEILAAAASAATLPGCTTAEAFYIPPVPQPAAEAGDFPPVHWLSELGGS